MEALLMNFSNKYFVLMTRITERGVLRINASNFSSLAKPVKRIPMLDCLIAWKEKTKPSTPKEQTGIRGPQPQDQRKASGNEVQSSDELGPITVERILHSMQSQAEVSSLDSSIREIDGASFLMAEVQNQCALLFIIHC